MKAVLLMGGQGSRLNGNRPKQYLPLGSCAMYEMTFATFEKSGLFSEIILVTPETGGKTRQESSYKGLLACGPDTDYVVIHDVARPFVSIDILRRNVEAVVKYNAVNTCIPSADTIVYVEGDCITQIPERRCCMRGQTPQSFLYALILHAHETTKREDATDDCSLVHDLGYPVHVVLGSEENFKITTQADYQFAKSLIL